MIRVLSRHFVVGFVVLLTKFTPHYVTGPGGLSSVPRVTISGSYLGSLSRVLPQQRPLMPRPVPSGAEDSPEERGVHRRSGEFV
eukprot:3692677-Pyramimonas_sp.AAC.3